LTVESDSVRRLELGGKLLRVVILDLEDHVSFSLREELEHVVRSGAQDANATVLVFKAEEQTRVDRVVVDLPPTALAFVGRNDRGLRNLGEDRDVSEPLRVRLVLAGEGTGLDLAVGLRLVANVLRGVREAVLGFHVRTGTDDQLVRGNNAGSA
jgi:hypothetical protein